jgi:rRNA-processing protein FCF1
MITVILDTNALFGQAWLTTTLGRSLVDLAAAGKCQVVLPQVVVDELDRQHTRTLRSMRDKAKGALKEVSDHIDATAIDSAFDSLRRRNDAAREALLATTGVSVDPVPEVTVRALVDRDMAARRPFMQTDGGKKAYGFRDAVIWETVLDFLSRDGSSDPVYFVTEDKGFLDDKHIKKLHQHLLDDLDARGIAHERVATDNLTNVVAALRAAAAEAEAKAAEARAASTPTGPALDLARLLRGYALDATRLSKMVRVATRALDELVGQSMDEELTYGGDYDRPSWVQFDVPSISESLSIYGYDLESEFEFDLPDGDIVTGRADVVLAIEAGERFGDSDEVRARVLIEIDTEDPERYLVTDIVLENNPNRRAFIDPTSVPLDLDMALDSGGQEVEIDPGTLGLDPGTR